MTDESNSPEQAAAPVDAGPRGRLAALIAPGSLFRGVLTLGSGTALSGGLLAATTPIISRLYAPSDFGRVGALGAFTAVASVTLSLKYEVAIVSARTRREAAALVFASFVAMVPSAVLAAGILSALLARREFGFAILPWSAVPIGVGVAVAAAGQMVLRYWFIREGEFRTVSQAVVAQSGLRAVLQVAFGLVGANWLGVVASELIGRAAGALYLGVRAAPEIAKQKIFSATEGWRAAAANRKFPLYSLPSSVLDALAVNAPIPVVLRLYGPESAGQYALMQLVIAAPLALIGGSAADAFHSRLSETARGPAGGAEALFWRTAKTLFPIAVVLGVGFTVCGEFAIRLLCGDRWALAGRLAASVGPWVVGQLSVVPLSRAVFVFEGQELKLISDLLNLIIVPLVLVTAHHVNGDLNQAVTWLSWVQLGFFGVYFLVLKRVVRTKA